MENELIRNPINHILETAAAKTPKNTAPADLDMIEIDLEKVRAASRGLLPIEKASRVKLTGIERNLLRQQIMGRAGLKFAQYPEFPMDAFSWRDKRGYPRLVIFSLNSANFEIGVITKQQWGRLDTHRTHTPEMPRPVLKMYDDVFKLLSGQAREERKSMRLRTTFEGLIPEEVKQQIVDTKPHFKRQFVVAEASRWDLTKSAPIRRVDPLLVGWDGYRMWLLASFDTTSVEKYIEKMALTKKVGGQDETS